MRAPTAKADGPRPRGPRWRAAGCERLAGRPGPSQPAGRPGARAAPLSTPLTFLHPNPGGGETAATGGNREGRTSNLRTVAKYFREVKKKT